MGIPGVFSLILVRDSVQGPSILAAISWDNTNDMQVRDHDDPSVLHRNTPPPIVGDDARDDIGPTIEIKA